MTHQAMSQAELVEASGVSHPTVRAVMHGKPGNYRPDRLQKISRALGWTPDSIHRILAGGEPDPMPFADPGPSRNDDDPVDEQALLERLEERVEELRALIARQRAERLSSGEQRPATPPLEDPAERRHA